MSVDLSDTDSDNIVGLNQKSEIHIDSEDLEIGYDELKKKYKKLQNDYVKLQTEYSENVIIQSMNDMKIRYERLIATTVPNYKYTILLEKYNRLIKYFTTCTVLLEHIDKTIRNTDKMHFLQDIKVIVKQIEMEVYTTKTILEEGLSSL